MKAAILRRVNVCTPVSQHPSTGPCKSILKLFHGNFTTRSLIYISLSQLQRLFLFLLFFLTDFAINERINLREFSFYFSAALAIRDSNREWD